MEGLTSLGVALRSAPRHEAIQLLKAVLVRPPSATSSSSRSVQELQVLEVIADLLHAGAIRFARERKAVRRSFSSMSTVTSKAGFDSAV